MPRTSNPDIGQGKLFDMKQEHLTLHDRFLIPPFTVLEQRGGYWQKRKQAWLDLGIRSELGRDEKLLGFESIVETDKPCPRCEGAGHKEGRPCRDCKGTGVKYGGYGKLGTTSVFDPVLCEIAYRWFCPPGGRVLDPFAGGSVRGVVAGLLGREYVGIDLREEQCAANHEQAAAIEQHRPGELDGVVWLHGDARAVVGLTHGQFDFLFTCPPYYDLEVYSDSPQDLSNAASYTEFRSAYFKIVADCVSLLAPNSFAAIVVGEVRDSMGNYVGLVPDTVRAFEDAGARFYNEAILVTPLGSVPVRTSAQFGGGRKLGKTHQQLLVFVKGDARKAAARNPVEEVALEQGGAVYKADATVEVPATGEFIDPSDPHGDGVPF